LFLPLFLLPFTMKSSISWSCCCLLLWTSVSSS
jgi:hypothetical protein